MKMTNWIVAVLVAGVLALTGCSKSSKMPDSIDVEGVKVSMPELQKSLSTSADKDVQASVGKVGYALRYRDYPGLQAELAKLAANPNLSDAQKKLVATVQDQVKQVLAKGAGAPTQ